ncbi:MAG: M23 family peptidase [Bacteroidetes bacterium QS_8_68_15]|nr:MAG: M23 family peptidase [Bacteroidetes bacterium QS_8_68_15]
MSKNKYYYYDRETCSFKEVKPKRSRRYAQVAGTLALSLVIAGLLAWSMDARWIGTPEEAALKAENEALQEQVADVDSRVERFSEKLDRLASTDRKLYRKLFQADPISKDVRRVGVGGSDPYEEFQRFDGRTAELMRQTEHALDRLGRQMRLQEASYRRLTKMAAQRRSKLAHLPAIKPADGPIVSGFGQRDHPVLKVEKMHAGIDILLDKGAPVTAPGKGTIVRSEFSPNYGNVVEIKHKKTGYTTRYAHLSRVPDRIAPGYEVERGETFAFSGNTGRSTGPHLHYEVRDEEGRAINPIYFFAPSMTPAKYRALQQKVEDSGAALDY